MFDTVFDPVRSAQLIEVIEGSLRQESMLIATRMSAVAELLRQRVVEVEAQVWDTDPDAGYMLVTGFARAGAEVAAALNLTPRAAGVLVSQADALAERLPRVGELLAAGRIDWRAVQLVIARTEFVTDTVMEKLDADLAARMAGWQCWSRKRIIDEVDAAVRELDPDAVRERERAEDRRWLDVINLGDGTAKINGIVSAEAGLSLDKQASEIAASVCPGDPRTMAQRRADAVTVIADGGTLVCRCGQSDCPAATEQPGRSGRGRFVINVIADRDTVLGQGNRPGYVAGYGVIDADQIRALAERATMRLLQEPEVGDTEAVRYQPSAALGRWIRYRDLTCRFPGCDQPAERCDIDHTVPFDHRDPAAGGLTVPSNLKCLCRHHHRIKTFDGWRDEQLADGTVIWTSPAGRTYRTTPRGADLFPELGRPACRAAGPGRRRGLPSRSERIAAMRERNRRLRPVNAERRRVDRHRRHEIAMRKNRNRMRYTLRFFKGDAPSTSPFCAWINDPVEPETLPPDWRPPPQPPPDPDDPPF
ncbi:DUF222 domain-containing protein [Mycobacterium sp. NPDC003449]